MPTPVDTLLSSVDIDTSGGNPELYIAPAYAVDGVTERVLDSGDLLIVRDDPTFYGLTYTTETIRFSDGSSEVVPGVAPEFSVASYVYKGSITNTVWLDVEDMAHEGTVGKHHQFFHDESGYRGLHYITALTKAATRAGGYAFSLAPLRPVRTYPA